MNSSYSKYIIKNGWCFFQIWISALADTSQHTFYTLPKSAFGNYLYFQVVGAFNTGVSGQLRIDSNGNCRINGSTAENYIIIGAYPIAQ